MQKIKIFKTGSTPEITESQINLWLQEHSEIALIKFFSAELMDDDQNLIPVLICFYDDPKEKSPDIKRQHERVSLNEIIDYRVGDQVYRDFIEDLSESGLFIKTTRSLPVGTEIVMTILSPDQDRPFKIKGTVTRSLPEGVGVQFIVESQVQADVIRSIVNRIEKDEAE